MFWGQTHRSSMRFVCLPEGNINQISINPYFSTVNMDLCINYKSIFLLVQPPLLLAKPQIIRLVVSIYPSEKWSEVSWDDDIPNWMESHRIPWFHTTNQSSWWLLYIPFESLYPTISLVLGIYSDYPPPKWSGESLGRDLHSCWVFHLCISL